MSEGQDEAPDEPVKVRATDAESPTTEMRERTGEEIRADTYERERTLSEREMTLRPSNTEEMEIEIRDRSVDRPRIGAQVRDGAGQPAMARDRFSGNPPFPLAGQAEVEDQGGIESEEDQRGRGYPFNPGEHIPLRVTLRHSDGGQYEIWIRNRCIQSFCGEFARVTRCPELDMGHEMQVRIHVVPMGEPRAIPQPQMQIEADRDEAPSEPERREEVFGEASMSLALARVRDAFADVERQILRRSDDDGVDNGVELHVRQHPTREDQLDAQVGYLGERMNRREDRVDQLAVDVRGMDGNMDNIRDSLSRRVNNLQESTTTTVDSLEVRIGNLERLATRIERGRS